jgi:Na+/phosphate symporter
VQIDDLEIDRLDLAIDESVLRALALQAPLADDLRKVIAIKMMASDLERVGDLSRNIAKSAERLIARPLVRPPAQLVGLADAAQRMLRDALDAFAESDTVRARAVLLADDRVDRDQDRSWSPDPRHRRAPGSQEVDMILIAENLERVGDHYEHRRGRDPRHRAHNLKPPTSSRAARRASTADGRRGWGHSAVSASGSARLQAGARTPTRSMPSSPRPPVAPLRLPGRPPLARSCPT